MKETVQKIKEKVKAFWNKFKKMLLSLLAAASLTGLCYFIYEHRKMIRAAVRFTAKRISKRKNKQGKCSGRKKK